MCSKFASCLLHVGLCLMFASSCKHPIIGPWQTVQKWAPDFCISRFVQGTGFWTVCYRHCMRFTSLSTCLSISARFWNLSVKINKQMLLYFCYADCCNSTFKARDATVDTQEETRCLFLRCVRYVSCGRRKPLQSLRRGSCVDFSCFCCDVSLAYQ